MSEWFNALYPMQQSLFVTGVVTTGIFLIQFLMTLTGIAGDSDVDLGDDGSDSGFDFADIFTIRNGVTFLMGFSWGGLMAFEWGLEHPLLMTVIGFFVGCFFVATNVFILIAMSRLRNSGNINLENAIDQEGRVTLTVPAHRQGVGKVMISIQGRLKEYHAVTDGDLLHRNAPVAVLDLSGSQLVVGPFVSHD